MSTETEPRRDDQVRNTLIRPLSDFLHKEASAGLLLIAAAVVAMVWANSPWADSYTDLWLGTHGTIGIEGFLTIELTLQEWVNDVAMVLFFFVAGLEIKRELTQGELRDPRQAALPIIAAFGGMVAPALIFFAMNPSGSGSQGWGIPMATDIALVMGVVGLLGTRAPSWLKLFLLALAIVDDIGAIIVIAVFYSEGVSFAWLALAAGSFAIAATLRQRVRRPGMLLLLGFLCWLGLHHAHIHTTLAGVAFGILAPVTAFRTTTFVDADELAENPDTEHAIHVANQARHTVSVVEWLQHRLHPWSAFLVVPVFGLANAGVRIPTDSIDQVFSSSVTWGVVIGLVVGKTIGITTATLLAVKLGVGKLPVGVTNRYVLGAATLAGIGFTVSLFVTELAFGHEAAGTDARVGVLLGSLIAGIIGAAILIPGKVDDDTDPEPGSESEREHVGAG